jgi:hypothetical protein
MPVVVCVANQRICAVELGRMTAGLSFPFKVIVDDCAGNSFVENLCAPHPDPCMSVRHYNRCTLPMSMPTGVHLN